MLKEYAKNIKEKLNLNSDMEMKDIIISVAENFVGIQELPPNLGFTDKEFEEAMIEVGWRKRSPWCAWFAELVWEISYWIKYESDEIQALLVSLFSANSQQTYRNFEKSKQFITSQKPRLGAIAVYGWDEVRGHTIAAVTDYTSKEFHTIEGNQNDRVKKHKRKYTSQLKGFIIPKSFDKKEIPQITKANIEEIQPPPFDNDKLIT